MNLMLSGGTTVITTTTNVMQQPQPIYVTQPAYAVQAPQAVYAAPQYPVQAYAQAYPTATATVVMQQ